LTHEPESNFLEVFGIWQRHWQCTDWKLATTNCCNYLI